MTVTAAEQVEYDPETALVVVDVQNDFADPSGSLYVSGGDEIVPVVNEHIRRARAAGATVVYTQDWHPPETPHFVTGGGQWPVHCVRDTWGAELHPELLVVEDERVHFLKKGTGGEDGYSAFTVRDPTSGAEEATELERILRDAGARRVVVCGLAEDVCVKETALDAARLGFDTVVVLEATRPVSEEGSSAARSQLREAGVTFV
ncbi:MAG: nicotinamidase [Acidimicrobiales bacterium]|nr:MAG: nicotinamidase [Acidimicrobiales bacterium]